MLDLGAAPGSWSQYASQQVGSRGRVLGIDLQAISLSLPQTVFLQADLRTCVLEACLPPGYVPVFDGVLSDMAPKTTGIAFSDQTQSFQLASLAADWAERFLKPGGYFVCKLFQGPDFETLRKRLRGAFRQVQLLRPQSTRVGSKEIFLIGMGLMAVSSAPRVLQRGGEVPDAG